MFCKNILITNVNIKCYRNISKNLRNMPDFFHKGLCYISWGINIKKLPCRVTRNLLDLNLNVGLHQWLLCWSKKNLHENLSVMFCIILPTEGPITEPPSTLQNIQKELAECLRAAQLRFINSKLKCHLDLSWRWDCRLWMFAALIHRVTARRCLSQTDNSRVRRGLGGCWYYNISSNVMM